MILNRRSFLIFFVKSQKSFPILLLNVVYYFWKDVADVFKGTKNFLLFAYVYFLWLPLKLFKDHKFFVGGLFFFLCFWLVDLLGDISKVETLDSVDNQTVHDFSQLWRIMEIAK